MMDEVAIGAAEKELPNGMLSDRHDSFRLKQPGHDCRKMRKRVEPLDATRPATEGEIRENHPSLQRC